MQLKAVKCLNICHLCEGDATKFNIIRKRGANEMDKEKKEDGR
jgi:hypothetical protein